MEEDRDDVIWQNLRGNIFSNKIIGKLKVFGEE